MKKWVGLLAAVMLAAACVVAQAEGLPSLVDIVSQNGTMGNASAQESAGAANGSSPEAPVVSIPAGLEINPNAKLTLMVYMCGSDLESRGDHASADIGEMAFSGFNSDEVNVIVMAGGARKWKQTFIPDGEVSVFMVKGQRPYTLARYGSGYSMGDPDLLSGFMELSYELLPAERYALILWDHGGGSLRGMCNDEVHSGDFLDMFELAAALKKATESRGKLEWIGFDACLMASAEVAGIVAPYAKYMVASEEVEPGSGWDYSFLLGIENDETGGQTGTRIIDAYFASATSKSSDALTLSCIDLSRIDGVLSSAGTIFETISEILTADSFASASNVRRSARSFGRNGNSLSNDYDLVDLGDLLKGYAEDHPLMAGFSDAIKAAVVYERSNRSGTTGLSVYHAFYNKGLYSQYRDVYPSLAISEEYNAYHNKFTGFLMSGTTTAWSDLETRFGQSGDRDVRTILTLNLTEAQFAELAEARLVALQQGMAVNSYRLVARQEAEIRQNGDNQYAVGGEYVHTNLFVVDSEGRPVWELPLLYVPDDNGAYQVDARLIREGEEPAYGRLICIRDTATNQVTIDNIWLYDEITGVYSPRSMASLDEYDTIVFTQKDRVETRSESGALLPFDEWTLADTNEYACSVRGGWQLAFVRDYLDVTKLSMAFEITDVYNSRYTSRPVVPGAARKDAPSMTVTYDDMELLLINAETATLAKTSDGRGLRLSVHITNISDAEALIRARNVRVNGVGVSAESAVYGMGSFDGLLPQETQMLRLSVGGDELAAVGDIETVEFDMILVDEQENELGIIPVTVSAHFVM